MNLHTNRPSAYLVYVHLGLNPSPTLIDFAQQAKNNLIGSEAILISDHPENWEDFPGKIIKYYGKQNTENGLINFLRKNPEKKTIARGYWLYTFERLYSLINLENQVHENVPILHFESDVVSYIDKSILSILMSNVDGPSVPRFNENNGVGSLVYFPNINHVRNFIAGMNKVLLENPHVDNDMNLLGLMLNSGKLLELPSARDTTNEIHLTYETFRIVFDGAAIGQYLFGQDPLHTKNRIISGYQNPHHPTDFLRTNWEFVSIRNKEYISFSYLGSRYLIVTAHVHSKAKIPILEHTSAFWIQCLAEANRETFRRPSEEVPDLIHSLPISLIDRFRIARKRGFYITLINKISRLVQNKKTSG